MMSGNVSVIIPAYNAEAFLAMAIRSCLEQTAPPAEIIVVNDGSTDGTVQVAESFGNSVRHLCQSRLGVSAARNAGISVATGDFIALLDADDCMTPDRLQLQTQLFNDRPDIHLAYGHQLIFRDGEDAAQLHKDGAGNIRTPRVAGAVTVRASVFEDAGLFSVEQSTAEMIEWFSRVDDAGCLSASVEQVVLYRRLHANNWSNQNRAEYVHAIKAILDRRRSG